MPLRVRTFFSFLLPKRSNCYTMYTHRHSPGLAHRDFEENSVSGAKHEL